MHPAAPLVTNPVTIFFIVLAIIVLAPVIFNRLRIPHIVGMIIAGVIVGPYGLNVLADDSSFIIFGQVGLLYLMFLAGLEIDMYHLKLNFRKGIFFGVMTFLIPIILGVAVSYYVLNLGLLTSFLLGSMYAAHTLISYPVTARYGINKAAPVLIAVVGTIFAVAGALLVMAVVQDIAATGMFEVMRFVWLLTKMTFYAVAVVVLYPWLTKIFLRRYSDRVTQYVFILALVFLSAWMAELIGLSAVLGAFLAGLVLNKYVPATSPLMSRIEFVGNSIFIPYFLINVGMMVNLRLLADKETIVISAVMLAVALISKWGAAWFSRVFYRMSAPAGNVMFGLTTAHTAVALAVVTIGYNTILADGHRMLDEAILNATIFVILVTCALAPIITANASGKLRLLILENENNEPKKSDRLTTDITNLLITISNPVTASGLMELALFLAGNNKKSQPRNIYLLNVRNDNDRRSRSVGNASLELAAKVASTVDIGVNTVQRFDINTVTGINNFIKERDIDTVVLGMHRKTTTVDTFLGPKIEQLLDQTRQTLVLTRCYVPLNTLARIVVYATVNAQLEAGFAKWVEMVAKLARQLSSSVTFYAPGEVGKAIRMVLNVSGHHAETQFVDVDKHDDFILLANTLHDEDLFICIGARPDTVSWTKEQADLRSFISNYLKAINLLIIYPQITDESVILPSFATPFE